MIIEELVLNKLRHLPHLQQQEVLHFVEYLETKFVQQATEKDDAHHLAVAAQALLADYETDSELVAFTALDGEAFHA
jgi:hypothetical protein